MKVTILAITAIEESHSLNVSVALISSMMFPLMRKRASDLLASWLYQMSQPP
jgi:hypothetical protein